MDKLNKLLGILDFDGRIHEKPFYQSFKSTLYGCHYIREEAKIIH